MLQTHAHVRRRIQELSDRQRAPIQEGDILQDGKQQFGVLEIVGREAPQGGGGGRGKRREAARDDVKEAACAQRVA